MLYCRTKKKFVFLGNWVPQMHLNLSGKQNVLCMMRIHRHSSEVCYFLQNKTHCSSSNTKYLWTNSFSLNPTICRASSPLIFPRQFLSSQEYSMQKRDWWYLIYIFIAQKRALEQIYLCLFSLTLPSKRLPFNVTI